jgi:hypothetical protein
MKKIGTALRGIAFRSTLGVLVGLIAYFLFLAVGAGLLIDIPIGSAMGILIAISPVIPVAFVLRSVMQLLRRTDELQQRIQLLAIGFSAAATGMLTFAYGLLEHLGYPHFDSALILPLMVMLWAIGILYFKWRFR